ncbi:MULTISPECIES: AbiV family abortive infection protein [Stenotrophomonas]|uniref:AbiV family abortive infection protein n=1 Tax=Stenotrophomonas sp. CFBP8994 TaxID=3096527 RepID=UPI002A6B7B40|nr:AbiV family abortive infection protein [Stenotrophomonas sp. CFBP8994]MDY0980716.1 AbiV family abortive infection protein [Stenotrophomonas sp. CFBP8994]
MDLKPEITARVRCFIKGAEMIHFNAAALYREALILRAAGAFARASVLHQISMEECSKVDTIGAVVVSILAGQEVDEASLTKNFRDHKAKNYANAYNAEPTDEEHSARERRDWEAAQAAFRKFQKDFHKSMNDIKKAGLYVDYNDGTFSAPVDTVNEAMSIACMQLNADFLRRGEDFIRLMKRIGAEPDRYAKAFLAFFSNTEAMRLKDELDAEAIVQAIVEQMRHQLGGSG